MIVPSIVHYSRTLSIMLLIAARCQTINVLGLSIAEYSEIIDIMLSISICTDVTDIHLDRLHGHNNVDNCKYVPVSIGIGCKEHEVLSHSSTDGKKNVCIINEEYSEND